MEVYRKGHLRKNIIKYSQKTLNITTAICFYSSLFLCWALTKKYALKKIYIKISVTEIYLISLIENMCL